MERLKTVLQFVQEKQVLVLHCRGMEAESSEVYSCLRYMLMSMVKREQLIHLHCFSGSVATARQWIEVFPNTYFGFTKMVTVLPKEQREAVKQMEEGRLLLETDAPYFHFFGHRRSTPALIGMVANEVAKIRGVDWMHLLEVAVANAQRLYLKRLPPQ
ncbi:putative deoxyribonuclease TATDN2 [Mercenaria mercenaria]|nr:putative deoxyribonuclease TATDN2 [Mercenaria mercenaria]